MGSLYGIVSTFLSLCFLGALSYAVLVLTRHATANREHMLRYVLRNRKTDDVLFVVNFALTPITKEAEEMVAEKEAQDDELD